MTGTGGHASAAAPVLIVFDQSNAYQARLMRGIRTAAQARDLPLLLVARDPFAHALAPSLQRALDSLRPRGVITSTLDTPEADEQLRQALAQRPWLASVQVGSTGATHWVRADNTSGMEAVVRHVIVDCGVRRPLVVRGIPHQPDSAEREAVVRRVFDEHGITLDDELFVDGHFHRDNAYHGVAELLRNRPQARTLDAVIALNDRSALGAMDAVTEAGLRVPQDVVVTGFDDDPLSAVSVPALTTVTQDLERQGELALTLLLRVLDEGAANVPTGEVRVPTRLVTRASTARTGGRRPSPTIPAPRTEQTATTKPPVSALGAHQLMDEIAALDTITDIARAFTACDTLDELGRELVAALPSLSITRCFLALTDGPLARIVLAHAPDDVPNDSPEHELDHDPEHDPSTSQASADSPSAGSEVFDAGQLLPPRLRHHLSQGALTLQPLSTERGERGYLLFQQDAADRFVGDALRLDLSRTLESLAHTAELAERTRTLKALVAQRTEELELEAQTRRRAEDELRKLNDELRARLHIDGLTGLCNRVGFDTALSTEWSSHSRSRSMMSLLMIDVDYFKRYNDAYGHLAGDECLRQLARCLREAVHRPDDVVARYGGEEFAMILPHTDEHGASVIAERVRANLRATALAHEASVSGQVTVSIGSASLVPHSRPEWDRLIAAADAALYEAKAAGRDGVVSALVVS